MIVFLKIDQIEIPFRNIIVFEYIPFLDSLMSDLRI